MAHMRPFAERFAAYHVETSHGTEIVPVEVCGELATEDDGTTAESCANLTRLETYCEGKPSSVTRKEGWYGRLSAPGYLDCTSWDGPHETADAALAAVKALYEVDDDGESDDGSDDE